MHFNQRVVSVVRPVQAEVIFDAGVIGGLGLSAQSEPHVVRALFQTHGVLGEFGSAGALDLPEKVHGAGGHGLAVVEALPRVVCFGPAQHELVVYGLARLSQVHGTGSEVGGSEGNLKISVLLTDTLILKFVILITSSTSSSAAEGR